MNMSVDSNRYIVRGAEMSLHLEHVITIQNKLTSYYNIYDIDESLKNYKREFKLCNN